MLTLQDPAMVKTKDRPRGALNKKRAAQEAGFDNSTRREPSRFEYIEANQGERSQGLRTRKHGTSGRKIQEEAAQGEESTKKKPRGRPRGRARGRPKSGGQEQAVQSRGGTQARGDSQAGKGAQARRDAHARRGVQARRGAQARRGTQAKGDAQVEEGAQARGDAQVEEDAQLKKIHRTGEDTQDWRRYTGLKEGAQKYVNYIKLQKAMREDNYHAGKIADAMFHLPNLSEVVLSLERWAGGPSKAIENAYRDSHVIPDGHNSWRENHVGVAQMLSLLQGSARTQMKLKSLCGGIVNWKFFMHKTMKYWKSCKKQFEMSRS
ncbi:hypothetical protein MMC22_004342 [Lobaria immixta]|nr:hypothetical protein [Lobaria immixta]